MLQGRRGEDRGRALLTGAQASSPESRKAWEGEISYVGNFCGVTGYCCGWVRSSWVVVSVACVYVCVRERAGGRGRERDARDTEGIGWSLVM